MLYEIHFIIKFSDSLYFISFLTKKNRKKNIKYYYSSYYWVTSIFRRLIGLIDLTGNGSLPVTSVSTSKFFSRVLIIPQPIANSRGASLSLKSPLRSVTKKLANLEKIIKFIKIVILVSSDFVHSRDFFNQHTAGIYFSYFYC